jgi:hypothetical protein
MVPAHQPAALSRCEPTGRWGAQKAGIDGSAAMILDP